MRGSAWRRPASPLLHLANLLFTRAARVAETAPNFAAEPSAGIHALPARTAGAGGLYCPSVKLYSSGHHLPRLEDEACPGTLPCPCEGQQERCLSTEAGTIDIPEGSTTVVQVRGVGRARTASAQRSVCCMHKLVGS